MMKIVNLTPHTVNVIVGDKTKKFKSEGIARCNQRVDAVGNIGGIPLTKSSFGEVEGLPEPTKDTLFIVSRLIMSACPTRGDLLVPNDMVRDDKGQIIGCKSFAIN